MAKDHSSRNTTVVLPGFKPVDPSLPDRRIIDLTGQTFGKLTALKYAGRRHVKNGTLVMWICRCTCGKLTLAASGQLKCNGHASCGCVTSARNWKRRTANIRKHPLYTTWNGIIRRTTDSLAYILRGICDGLREFDHFVSVMGNKPTARHSVDRINNNEGYWCGCCDECIAASRTKNVRWATPYEQANNQSRNRLITYKGRTQTVSQWATEIGMDRGAVKARLIALNWGDEAIIDTPRLTNGSGRLPLHSSEDARRKCAEEYNSGATLSELALKYGSDRHTVANILKRMNVSLRSRSEWMKVGLRNKRRRISKQRLLFT